MSFANLGMELYVQAIWLFKADLNVGGDPEQAHNSQLIGS